MPTDPLTELAKKQRAALLAREHVAERQLIAALAETWDTIQGELSDLMDAISQAKANGAEVDIAWIRSYHRLNDLRTQIEQRLMLYALSSESLIFDLEDDAIRMALANAEELMIAALGTPPPALQQIGVSSLFNRLPDEAITTMIGNLQAGSPLRALLQSLAGEAANKAYDAMVNAIALGYSPARLAGELESVLGVSLSRALTIARTETLRAYRQANIDTFYRNRDVVTKWVWSAQLSTRTCVVCWSMHGSEHPVTEAFGSHPNCRCVPVPKTKSWEELGFEGIPDTRPRIEQGADAFAQLSREEQLEILGPAKYDLYERGVPISAFVGVAHSKEWGTTRYELSKQAALDKHEGR